MKVALGVLLCITVASAQFDPHYVDGRNTIAQLFEWKWADIANECENFLSLKGYAGVQISPPSENGIVTGRPWLERYQVVSHNLTTRSGNEAALADMIKRCNNVGIRIYVDIVLNHMSLVSPGTDGNTCDPTTKSYPAIPYTSDNFHTTCAIDFTNATSIRVCELAGLKDLDQSQEYVRSIIRDYLNHLVSLGVAGFRVDLAAYIWPADLSAIFASVDDLSVQFFPSGTRAVIYQEIDDTTDYPVYNNEYTGFGRALEFKYGVNLSSCFRGNTSLANLWNYGPSWGLLNGGQAVSFIDNHDTERSNAAHLNYKEPKAYKAAIAFMLAHPYDGLTKVLSSFNFSGYYDPPPADSSENIISPVLDANGTCTNGWVCQHRWSQISNMVQFRNVVAGTLLLDWWSSGDHQIAFSRGTKGFYAATVSGDIDSWIWTSLPDGSYCDVISGSLVNGACTGKAVTVRLGFAHIQLAEADSEAALALHVLARL